MRKTEKRGVTQVLSTFLLRSTKCCDCHEKCARRIRSIARAVRNHHHVPNQKMTSVLQNGLTVDPFKTSSKLPNTAPRLPPKPPLIWTHDVIRRHTTSNLTTCRKRHACHADEKMSDVLHLSRKTKFQTSKWPESPTPAMKNGHC